MESHISVLKLSFISVDKLKPKISTFEAVYLKKSEICQLVGKADYLATIVVTIKSAIIRQKSTDYRLYLYVFLDFG